MKVIDLLNKIANGEDLPKKIIVKGITYEYIEAVTDLYRTGWWYSKEEPLNIAMNEKALNLEVEVIDTDYKDDKPITKESIEALGYACGEMKKLFESGWNKSIENKPLKEDKKIEYVGRTYDLTEFYRDYKESAEMLKDMSIKMKEIIDRINEEE